MFHLKFLHGDHENNVSCPRYEVVRRLDCATVSVYKGLTNEGGVDFKIGESTIPVAEGAPMFSVCFVTNEVGKTVDRIGPF